jgi:hypothetical protein
MELVKAADTLPAWSRSWHQTHLVPEDMDPPLAVRSQPGLVSLKGSQLDQVLPSFENRISATPLTLSWA